MQVACDNDLVIGVCTHFVTVPTPAGPVPTPIPHPFVAPILDPSRKAVENIGKSMTKTADDVLEDRPMMCDCLPVCNAGTITSNQNGVPHAAPPPPGVSWVTWPKLPLQPVGILEQPPPPGSPAAPESNALLDKGSSKCKFSLGETVRMGDMAKNCSEPARQTSTVIAPPKSIPILFG